jgi:hypothetical protein
VGIKVRIRYLARPSACISSARGGIVELGEHGAGVLGRE